jgi:biopolymer transport protein ExbD
MQRALLAAFFLACEPPAADASAIDPASLALPQSSTAEPAIDDLPVVILTKTKLVLSGVPRASLDLPLGPESMDGPIIDPLRKWLKDAHLPGHDMAVAIDSAATSDHAMQVLATCLDAGFSSFHVAVSREGATAQIPLSFGKPDAPGSKVLAASVFQGGVILSVPEGNIAPGCDGLGAGVTVSRVTGVIDRDKLSQCVAQTHKKHATNAASVLVTKTTVFSDVVTLLDTMRHDAETPSIALGISP